MDARIFLADFLRVRRELLQPEDVGLLRNGNRRVPGLRREEVAQLAGISADYYLRLEQGRQHQPSEQVLSALSRALRLDTDEQVYLHRVGRHTPSRPPNRSGQPWPEAPAAAPEVADGLVELLASWTLTPAYLSDRNHDVLATNAMAQALAPDYLAPGTNLLSGVFAGAGHAHSRTHWEQAARILVASLRYNAHPEDLRLQEIVGALSVRSREFRRMWALHDVRPQTSGTSQIQVEPVGWVDLRWQTLQVPSAEGQFLTTFFADPGSLGESALAQLAKIARTITRPPAGAAQPALLPAM